MATKTFNAICVEYAHQLGKGLPLTPTEMCNAVIMYLNAQITEMQGITTALQTAVSEAESSATEATNTANELSEKVDTLQTNVTEAESNATEALNKANDVSETVNALPKVPTPTTSDNGKVIGVQSGAYVLVEQSGGEAPANVVTTDTKQTITGKKIYIVDDNVITQFSDGQGNFINVGRTNIDINTFRYGIGEFGTMPSAMINIPNKAGTLALKDDIPDFKNYYGIINIMNGTFGGSVRVYYTGNSSPYTKYGYDKIETYGDSDALQYTLKIPNKNGTIATLDDISNTPSSDKYFTRVIYRSIDDDTQYIIFSCITDTDLSANTSYQNVIDLLNSLGANTHDAALPCIGKTVSGVILVGIYTDEGTILVFDIDNSIEELNMSADITFISI